MNEQGLSLETQLVLRELDHLRDDIGQMRTEVGELREAVARLESEGTGRVSRPRVHPIVRDGGMTISAATLGGGLLWLIQHVVAK